MNPGTIVLPISLHAAAKGDNWIHLIPAGSFTGKDGRGPFVLADPAAVIAESRNYAGKQQIPIDYEHQIDNAAQNGMPAPAAGWITALQQRADGIWGRVSWTGKAAEHIANGEYRYISPVITHTASGEIVCLLRAALTNSPNLDSLTALFTANPQSKPETLAMDQLLARLRKALGLPDTANEDAIFAAIEQLATAQNAASPDLAKYVPIGEFERVVQHVNSLNAGVSRQNAEFHVDLQIRNGNMPTYLKDWGISLCCMNKPAFDAFITRTKGLFNTLTAETVLPKAKFGATAQGALSDDEKAVCLRMGLTADEFAKSKAFINS